MRDLAMNLGDHVEVRPTRLITPGSGWALRTITKLFFCSLLSCLLTPTPVHNTGAQVCSCSAHSLPSRLHNGCKPGPPPDRDSKFKPISQASLQAGWQAMSGSYNAQTLVAMGLTEAVLRDICLAHGDLHLAFPSLKIPFYTELTLSAARKSEARWSALLLTAHSAAARLEAAAIAVQLQGLICRKRLDADSMCSRPVETAPLLSAWHAVQQSMTDYARDVSLRA